jgi:hypothetical protein
MGDTKENDPEDTSSFAQSGVRHAQLSFEEHE